MPLPKNPTNFDPDAKNKSFSTATQKPNQCRSTILKWSHFRQPTHNRIHFILHWNQVKFDPNTEIKTIWTTHTKYKSTCVLTLTTSDFRPAFKNQVNFDRPHNNQINFIPRLKSSKIWSTRKSSQFARPTQKKQTVFMLVLKTSDFRPAYK